MTRVGRLVVVLGFLLLLPSAVMAQLSTGQISGRITDDSGAVTPGRTAPLSSVMRPLIWPVDSCAMTALGSISRNPRTTTSLPTRVISIHPLGRRGADSTQPEPGCGEYVLGAPKILSATYLAGASLAAVLEATVVMFRRGAA